MWLTTPMLGWEGVNGQSSLMDSIDVWVVKAMHDGRN